MYKKIPGTKDILPAEVCLWQKIEEEARRIFSLYNFQEIRPPLIEEASLFNRSLGQASEIVTKQMFLIKNKEDLYALRPEATASIVRCYIENNLYKTSGFSKLYYIGPMFRMERPQKGRLRQFHHIGAEAIGSPDADLDVEVILLVDNLLKAFFIENYKIKINSIGCAKDKSALGLMIRDSLKGKLNKLCADCKLRFKNNALRILDCKEEQCRKIIQELEIGDSCLCPECKGQISKVKSGLYALKLDFTVDHFLVRGLDYYTGVVFEITHPDLGAQDALGAGGRYDNLVRELGGPQLGAVGFAFGAERLLLVAKPQINKEANKNLVYLITLGQEAKKKGMLLLRDLRKAGVAADTDYEAKSLKGAMRKANDLGAGRVLIMGEDEIKKDCITLKSMASGEQKEVKSDSLILELKC